MGSKNYKPKTRNRQADKRITQEELEQARALVPTQPRNPILILPESYDEMSLITQYERILSEKGEKFVLESLENLAKNGRNILERDSAKSMIEAYSVSVKRLKEYENRLVLWSCEAYTTDDEIDTVKAQVNYLLQRFSEDNPPFDYAHLFMSEKVKRYAEIGNVWRAASRKHRGLEGLDIKIERMEFEN